MTNKDKNELDMRKLACNQTTIEKHNYMLIAGMLVEGHEKEEIIEYLKYFAEDCEERENKKQTYEILTLRFLYATIRKKKKHDKYNPGPDANVESCY